MTECRPQFAEPSFFDRLNIAGLPEGIRLAAGLAHEVSAARACVAENSIAKACENWQRIRDVLPRMSPELAAGTKSALNALMKERNCP